jgi:hypothetical protein
VTNDERDQILALTEKLVEPELSAETRLGIAVQIRLVLLGETKDFEDQIPVFPLYQQALLAHAPPGFIQSVSE